MASLRVPTVGLSTVALALALTSCAPSPMARDVGYERIIGAVVRAESDAGGRAYAVEVDDDTVEVKVATGDRAVEIDVDLSGPTVTDRRNDALDADDREAVTAAVTTLADGVRIAAAAHRGEGGISEVELQRDSEIAWEIEFTDGGEVAVAVDDGAVLNADG